MTRSHARNLIWLVPALFLFAGCHPYAAWSPAGDRYALTLSHHGTPGAGLVVGTLGDSELRRVPDPGWGRTLLPQFSPDGRQLAYLNLEITNPQAGPRDDGSTVRLRLFDLESDTFVAVTDLWPGTSPWAIRTLAGQTPVDLYFLYYDWSPDGKWVAYHEVAGATEPAGPIPPAVALLDVATGATRPLIPASAHPAFPAWSPDSERVACLIGNPMSGMALADPTAGDTRLALWTVDRAGGHRELASFPVVRDVIYSAPSWSPDGKRVAVIAVPDTPGAVRDRDEAWRDAALLIIDAATGELAVVGSAAELVNPQWSPAGDRIAAEMWGEHRTGIAVFDLRTGECRRRDGMVAPAWSPTGDRLIVLADGGYRLADPATLEPGPVLLPDLDELERAAAKARRSGDYATAIASYERVLLIRGPQSPRTETFAAALALVRASRTPADAAAWAARYEPYATTDETQRALGDAYAAAGWYDTAAAFYGRWVPLYRAAEYPFVRELGEQFAEQQSFWLETPRPALDEFYRIAAMRPAIGTGSETECRRQQVDRYRALATAYPNETRLRRQIDRMVESPAAADHPNR